MAAWEWSRMRPLTDNTPKPLLKICGKTLIEHNIEPIIHLFDEIFFVVQYKEEQFPLHFGDTYHEKPVHYITQISEKSGTWAAILSLKWKIQWEFVVLSGDDLYDADDIKKLVHQPGYATLCKQVENPENFWIFTCDTNWRATGIVEKPTDLSIGNLANIGNHKFDDKIFWELATLPLSPRGELEITDLIDLYIQRWIYSVVEATGRWISIGYPWDLLRANDTIIGNYTETVDNWAVIESNVSINWNIYLEEGATLKSGTYIEGNVYIGKNCIIWPNAYIRWNTSIWSQSKVWSFVELKNSYVGSCTHIPHLSYIGDSVIWDNSNLWGGTKVANLRHDGGNIRAKIKEKLIDTWRHKLGGIIGDNVHTGINTLIYPGRIISTNGTTLPWEIVK